MAARRLPSSVTPSFVPQLAATAAAPTRSKWHPTAITTSVNLLTTIAGVNGANSPIPGLDRCTNPAEASPQGAVDDGDARHVFVACTDSTGGGNENTVLRDSFDGGLSWPRPVSMNGSATARRFLPWICATKGIAWVSWYDRRFASQSAPDLTAYFANFASATINAITPGTETNVS